MDGEILDKGCMAGELPDDLIRGILYLLPAPDRARAGATCRRWHAVARAHPFLARVGGPDAVWSLHDHIALHAEDDQIILLAPGRYYEDVVVSRNVHIVGPRTAVLCGGTDPEPAPATLTLEAPVASVHGITIRRDAASGHCVIFRGGSRARLQHCLIEGRGRGRKETPIGVALLGRGTEPAIWRNVVRGTGDGICFTAETGGRAEGNEISECATAIFVSPHSKPVVRFNHCHDCSFGVRASARAVSSGDVGGNIFEPAEEGPPRVVVTPFGFAYAAGQAARGPPGGVHVHSIGDAG
eukprot:tig00021275_g19876.t1